MEKLLYLVHRIPFPPNKGDKIRSYNLLKGLCQEYQIFLGTFIDDRADWQYADEIKELCSATYFHPLNPSVAKIKSFQGFVHGKALSVPYYSSAAMQQWVDEIIEKEKIHKVLVFSSAMGQFIHAYHNVSMTVDFVDVDSDKWRQYAEKKAWPMSWVFKREAKYLLKFDEKLAEQSQASIFVSEQEAGLFRKLVNTKVKNIRAVNNGVDTAFFSPANAGESPYKTGKVIVFTGAMDYWANVDAVLWFAEQVFPLILKQLPETRFYIVGSKPVKSVLELASQENIHVTGRVADIRPYVVHAGLAVAPLRIARGIQNKVLEAMAMGQQVVASPQAIEGISINQALDVSIEEAPEKFSQRVCELLAGGAPLPSIRNRQFIKDQFSWENSTRKLIGILSENDNITKTAK